MAKRNWTPEERKAWGEKMRAAREAKTQTAVVEPEAPQVATQPAGENSTSHNNDPPQLEEASQDELLARVKELESYIFRMGSQQPGGPQVTAQGIRGTLTKYSVNPKDYPDPTDRLFEEPRLKLKDFNRNWWDLEWEVGSVKYETKDGINMREPKFQVKLIRIIEDENGEPSNRRYVLHKATFFEDPQAAIDVAHQHGLEVGEELEKAFLDEMRYLRVRDWVLESFYAPKPDNSKKNLKEEVIGNRLVSVYEIDSEKTESIPFHEMKKKG